MRGELECVCLNIQITVFLNLEAGDLQFCKVREITHIPSYTFTRKMVAEEAVGDALVGVQSTQYCIWYY